MSAEYEGILQKFGDEFKKIHAEHCQYIPNAVCFTKLLRELLADKVLKKEVIAIYEGIKEIVMADPEIPIIKEFLDGICKQTDIIGKVIYGNTGVVHETDGNIDFKKMKFRDFRTLGPDELFEEYKKAIQMDKAYAHELEIKTLGRILEKLFPSKKYFNNLGHQNYVFNSLNEAKRNYEEGKINLYVKDAHYHVLAKPWKIIGKTKQDWVKLRTEHTAVKTQHHAARNGRGGKRKAKNTTKRSKRIKGRLFSKKHKLRK